MSTEPRLSQAISTRRPGPWARTVQVQLCTPSPSVTSRCMR